MTRKNSIIVTLILITVLTSCKAQNADNIESFYSDGKLFKIDTVINDILIDNKSFSLTVCRDKLNEHLERFTESEEPTFEQSPMTIVFKNSNDGKCVYIKKFDFEPNDYPYLNYSFYKSQGQTLKDNGKLYFYLNKSYGGSGSRSNTYLIDFKGNQINFSQLFESSGELTYIVYNKNDNEIIVLDGIWNMKEGEGHFANHRYKIKTYTYENNSFTEKEIGQTKFKYSSLDENKPISQILSDIKAKEPILLNGINLSDYK